jgi:hypothetical protein
MGEGTASEAVQQEEMVPEVAMSYVDLQQEEMVPEVAMNRVSLRLAASDRAAMLVAGSAVYYAARLYAALVVHID